MPENNAIRNLTALSAVLWAALAPGAENELPPLAKWRAYAGTNNVCTTITYDKPDCRPIWFGASSACENAVGAGNYSMYLDLYEEGGEEWAVEAKFSQGTHGWERSEHAIVPKRPVKEIRCFLFLRRATSGVARFDKPFLRREMPPKGHVMKSERRTLRPFADADQVACDVSDGKKIVRECRREAPTLQIACPLKKDEVAVWTADSMRRVSPLTFPTRDETASPRLDFDLAKGERESGQICVSVGAGTTAKGVSISVSPLVSPDGATFAGSVEVRRIGYLARRPGYNRHPLGMDERELWFAEPLLPNAPFEVSPFSTRGVWLTALASRDAKPGLYAGRIEVAAEGRATVSIPLTLRVRSFALPATFGLKTAFCVMDGFTRAAYPDDFKARKRESWDLMLDHRLNPDDISRTTPPDIGDLLHARARGMSSFNALNLVPPPKSSNTLWVCWSAPEEVFSASTRAALERTLKPYVAKLREHGLDRLAYLYGFDERGTAFYPQMLAFCREMREMTSLPVLTTAYMFRDTVQKKLSFDSPYATMTDWHCPLSSVYDADLADRYRAKGKQVWIYTCCGPQYPHANCSSYEYPLVECRLLGWLVRRLRADGFLFWHVNYWPKGGKIDERETFFPAWDTYSGLHMPGDGIFLYPGREHIVPGIRLANIRDGVEDYEWLQMAEAKVGRGKVGALLERVVRGSADFTRDPAVVRAARRAIGDLLEELEPPEGVDVLPQIARAPYVFAAPPNAFAGKPDCKTAKFAVKGLPDYGRAAAIVLTVRATDDDTHAIEVGLRDAKGGVWGSTGLPIRRSWSNITLPLDEMAYFDHWGLPPVPPDATPNAREFTGLHFCFGKWLCANTLNKAHGFEVKAVRLVKLPPEALAEPKDASLAAFGRLAGEDDDTGRFRRAIHACRGRVLDVPAGTYRVSSTLVVDNDCSIRMDKSATIVAVREMPFVFELTGNGSGRKHAHDYNRFFIGGRIDGAGLASCMRVAGYAHFTMRDTTFLNGKLYGLRVDGGYEVIANNLYFKCLIPGLAGNSALYINGGDSHYTDCVAVDYTIGVNEVRGGSNRFTRCHVWGGPLPPAKKGEDREMLKDSINFRICGGSTILRDCYADTGKTGFELRGWDTRLLGCSYFNNKHFGLDDVTIVRQTGGGRALVSECAFCKNMPRTTVYEGKGTIVWRNMIYSGFGPNDACPGAIAFAAPDCASRRPAPQSASGTRAPAKP